MSFTIQAPLDGSLIGLRSVPDPVFADQLVGPGIAIVPAHADSPSDVCAPVSGAVKTLHPHAFIIELEAGPLVLVHIGIDTVSLQGRGFEALSEVGAQVEAGAPLIRWDPRVAKDAGRALVVPIVVLSSQAQCRFVKGVGAETRQGEAILTVKP